MVGLQLGGKHCQQSVDGRGGEGKLNFFRQEAAALWIPGKAKRDGRGFSFTTSQERAARLGGARSGDSDSVPTDDDGSIK